MRPEPTPAWKTATQVGIALGFLLVIGGVVVRDLQVQALAESRTISLALLIGGAVITVGCLAANYDLLLRLLVQRRTAEGANAAVMILLAVALTALVCYISTRRYARIDMTGKRLYTLHTKTKRMLRTLDRPVEVTIVYSQPDPVLLGRDPKTQLVHWGHGQAVAMLDEFSALSKHVTVRKLGLEDPGQLQELRARLDVPGPCIIFEAGERNDVIPLVDIVEMPAWQGVSPSFTGEDAFATALAKIVGGRTQTVYFLTGHGERLIEGRPSSAGIGGPGDLLNSEGYSLSRLVKRLKGDNFQSKPLNLSETGAVPQDCAVLVVAGPRVPLAEAHLEAIRQYLSRPDARLLLMLDSHVRDREAETNVGELLAPYGITAHLDAIGMTQAPALDLSTGAIVRVGNDQITISSAGYADHAVTSDLHNYEIQIIGCAPLELGEAAAMPGFSARPLLTAGQTSWGETTPWRGERGKAQAKYDPDKDVEGPVVACAVVEPAAPTSPSGPPPTDVPGARIVVLGSSMSFVNQVVSANPPNLYLLMNSVNWLAGKGHMVGIPARDINVNVASVSPLQVRLSRWIFIFALPGAIAALGLVVWQVRRR